MRELFCLAEGRTSSGDPQRSGAQTEGQNQQLDNETREIDTGEQCGGHEGQRALRRTVEGEHTGEGV